MSEPTTAAGRGLVDDVDRLTGPAKDETWEAYRRAVRALVLAGIVKAEEEAHEAGRKDCHE